jgi:hypothetical protein
MTPPRLRPNVYPAPIAFGSWHLWPLCLCHFCPPPTRDPANSLDIASHPFFLHPTLHGHSPRKIQDQAPPRAPFHGSYCLGFQSSTPSESPPSTAPQHHPVLLGERMESTRFSTCSGRSFSPLGPLLALDCQ